MMMDIAEREPDKDTKLRWIRRDLGKLSSQLNEIKTKMNSLLEELDKLQGDDKHNPEFRSMTDEECLKYCGFNKSDMELLYNNGERLT